MILSKEAAIYLTIAEQSKCLAVKEDGVVLTSIPVDHVLHFGLQGIVPFLVLLLHSPMEVYLKAFYHKRSFFLT